MRTVTFALFPLRFGFTAREDIFFPAGKSGNILRGAFGTLFRQTASAVTYSQIFEPRSSGGGPSGLADSPRPFVFRAMHLDGRTISAGERFHFDLHLFITADPPLPEIIAAFAQLAEQGLGPRRGRAELTDCPKPEKAQPLEISLSPALNPVSRIRVRYLTPTELKSGDGLATRPEFAILFSRARDRVASLRALYGSGPLAIDFRSMGDRSRDVVMVGCDLRHVDAERRSSRTGQTHPLGGFIGEAEYEGDLTEFLPYLKVAEWTGVGRQTVWGKGQIACDEKS
jgi:hypothetical protein